MPNITENRSRFTALLPGLGLAVLSKFTCSACLGAYSGLLASLGLGFAATGRGLTILTAVLLGVGLASVVWSTLRHRYIGPLVTVLVGSGVVLAARLIAPSSSLLLAGAGLTLLGSLWSLWLERSSASCCATAQVNTQETTV